MKPSRAARLPLAVVSFVLVATGPLPPAAGASTAVGDNAGVFRVGVTPGGGTAAIPIEVGGARAVLTAKHVVGSAGSGPWALTGLDGTPGSGLALAVSSSIDAAAIARPAAGGSEAFVALAPDLTARFVSWARSPDDAQVGDRVCRTGTSPLSSGIGAPSAIANFGSPPDTPALGRHVICGRVTASNATSVTIGKSDRPDGLMVGQGDSGGPVWKVVADGTFLFVGIFTTASQSAGTVAGLPVYKAGNVLPAWRIFGDSSLGATPNASPTNTTSLSIEASTYRPTPGGSVTVRGALRDAQGTSLPNQAVQILAGSPLAVIGFATTDDSGAYSYQLANVTQQRAVAVRYPGGDGQAAAASRVLSIGPTQITLTSAPTTASSGSTAEISGAVLDAAGRAVVGRQVELRSYPPSAPAILATATTDIEGTFHLGYVPSGSGLTYAVRFSGDTAEVGNPAGAAASRIVDLVVT